MSNFNNIARKILEHSNNSANRKTDMLGFFIGHVTPQGIITKRFKEKPITEYKMLEYMTLEDEYMTDTYDSEHNSKVRTPNQFKPIKPGDIVIMAYIENEFVVFGRLKKEYE